MEEDTKKAKEFLEISEQDLKSSEILFKNGIYPNAVFFLQQSVEKWAKFFFLCGEYSFDELKKKTRHDISEKYKETIEKFIPLFEILDMPNHYKFFDNLKSDDPTLEFEETINKIIDLVNKVDVFEFKPVNLTKEKKKGLKRLIKKQVKPLIFKKIATYSFKVISENIEDYVKFSLLVVSNFCLNLILQPHVTSSRYPDKESNPSKYSESHPLLKNFPELLKIQKRILDDCKKFFNFNP